MADEIAIYLRLSVVQGFFADAIEKQLTDDFPILDLGGGIQIIGTTEEALVFGDVTYEGWLYLENLDPTNTIDWGPDSSGMVASFVLPPGMASMVLCKPGVTFKARARNAECRMFIKCYGTGTST